MKTITETNIPLPSPIGNEKLDTLCITVGHTKRGHYIHFNPVKRFQIGDQYVTTSVMLGNQYESGYFLFLDSSPRKNPHYIARAMRAVSEFDTDLSVHYFNQDRETVELYVRTINSMAEKK